MPSPLPFLAQGAGATFSFAEPDNSTTSQTSAQDFRRGSWEAKVKSGVGNITVNGGASGLLVPAGILLALGLLVWFILKRR